jgi:DNA-binding transcriptional ArsR family regulator
MSALFSVNGADLENSGDCAFYSLDGVEKIQEIDESKIPAAIDAFSSPKRINILKALMAKRFLSSNELTMKTGCIGGQLYHHLSNLANAGLIIKEDEKYRAHPDAPALLIRLFATVGGMKIARE